MCSRPMELNDTIDMMTSNDYKERFKAEYYQTAIRYANLRNILNKWDDNELNSESTCLKWVYDSQMSAMGDYIYFLKKRAEIEGIEI